MTEKAIAQIDIVDVTDAYSVILTNESHTFPGTTNTAEAGSTTTKIIAMRGAETIGASVDISQIVKSDTNVTITKDTNTTSPTLTITVSTAVTSNGTIDIPVVVDGNITIHKTFSYTIAFSGSAGKGISSTAITYQASTSGTTTPTGTWLTTIPAVSATQYLWTKTVITYTDATTSTSYSVGMMGAPGVDAITLTITSSAGIIFKNTAISTQLTAHVFQGGLELTSSTSPKISDIGTLHWYKDDTEVTSASGNTTLAISAGDVTNKATYTVKLEV